MLHTIWYKKTIVPNTTPSQLKVYFSSQSNLKIIFIYLKLPMNEWPRHIPKLCHTLWFVHWLLATMPRGDRATNARFSANLLPVGILRCLCDDSTEMALCPCNLRAASVRICRNQSLNNPYKNRTIIVYINVNTNAVVRNYLRCREIVRQIEDEVIARRPCQM